MSQIYNTVDIDCFIILIVCWFCWCLSVWIVRCILNWTCKQTYPACRSRFFPRQYYFKCAWIWILKAVNPSILELCLIYHSCRPAGEHCENEFLWCLWTFFSTSQEFDSCFHPSKIKHFHTSQCRVKLCIFSSELPGSIFGRQQNSEVAWRKEIRL